MPRIRKQYRRRGRKPAYKKKRYGQKNTLVNSSLRPIPSRFITKHKYAEAITVSTPGMGIYKWNLNSLWDPNRTGVGHQPYGYDQLAALYNRYRVISCKYILSAISDSSNIAYACLPANDTAATISNVSEARENPRCKYAVQNTGGTLKVLKGNVYLPSLVGQTKTQYMSDDRFQAIVGNSPVELCVLNVFGQGMNDDPVFNPQITYNILLEFTVEWFDIQNFEQS